MANPRHENPLRFLLVVLLASGCELAEPRAADDAGELAGKATGALAHGGGASDPRDDPDCELIEKNRDIEEWLCRGVAGREEEGADAAAHGDGVICWYRTWIIRIDGLVITWTEFLGCDGPPGGGSCGGGDPGGEDTLAYCLPGRIWLDCDKVNPKRGDTVKCGIKSDTLSLSKFTYAWTVDPGSWTSADSAWEGDATSTREISVVVRDSTGYKLLGADKKIEVQPRSWQFDSMSHPPPRYAVPPGANRRAWGGYETHSLDGSQTREGSGPWEGEFFMDRPMQLRGEMYLHPDFVDGKTYPNADTQACTAAPHSAGVLTVNGVCGGTASVDSLAKWKGMVEAHEQKHEDGANQCLLRDAAATAVLKSTEAIVRASGFEAREAFNELMNAFLNGPLALASETNTSTPLSPVIWQQRDSGRWQRKALLPYPHSGTSGCP